MLTMSYILARTPHQRIMDAGLVKLLQQKAGYLNGDVFFAATTQSVRERLPNGNIIRITGKPKYVTVITVLNKRGHVHLSCSCDDFKFRLEYPLSTRDAATIEFSNGDPTRMTNPELIPYACKHLIKLYQVIKPRLDRVVKI